MRAFYTSSPIGSINALCLALGVDESALVALSKTVDDHYSEFEIEKKSGGTRKIAAPSRSLKYVQRRINRAVFENVNYPDYLFGGISNRDYLRNAKFHSGARVLIALDVKDFYPSLDEAAVKRIFQYFCKFPVPVSTILAKLTTLNGVVPQGACTSSHIANLAFFSTEPILVHELRQRGIKYSRLLDDITLSSTTKLSNKTVTDLIGKVTSMLRFSGCKLKSSKTRVTSMENPAELMMVTGLWLNRGHPRVLRSDRENIRLEVDRCLKLSGISLTSLEYHAAHDRVSGRVAKLAYVGHPEAVKYREQLSSRLPLYDAQQEKKTRHLMRALLKINKESWNTSAYADRYYQIVHRLNIHARSNYKFSNDLRESLVNRMPTISREERRYGE